MHITASVFINDDAGLWAGCTTAPANAHLKWNATRSVARDGAPSEAVVVAVTNGRLDGFALLTRTFGKWERIFWGQAEGLARESRWPAAEAGAGHDHRRVGVLRTFMSAMGCGSGGPQPRDGLYDKVAGAEVKTLSPGLDFGLKLGGLSRWASRRWARCANDDELPGVSFARQS
jgi:hypothetical protein